MRSSDSRCRDLRSGDCIGVLQQPRGVSGVESAKLIDSLVFYSRPFSSIFTLNSSKEVNGPLFCRLRNFNAGIHDCIAIAEEVENFHGLVFEIVNNQWRFAWNYQCDYVSWVAVMAAL